MWEQKFGDDPGQDEQSLKQSEPDPEASVFADQGENRTNQAGQS